WPRGTGGVLGWALRHRLVVVFVSLMFFGAALSAFPLRLLGAEFMPAEDQAEFTANIEMPPATSLEATDQAVAKVEARLKKVPEITGFFTSVGLSTGGMLSGSDSRHAIISIKLVPKSKRARSLTQITKEVEGLGEGIPGMEIGTQLPSMAGPAGKPLQLQLTGDDGATLTKLAAGVEAVLKRTPGVANVANSAGTPAPEVRVDADQARLADLGLTPAQVGMAVRTSVEGVIASQFRPEGHSSVDIRVIASDVDRSRVADLPSLPLATAKGGTVSLGQASTVRTVDAPNQIDRLNRQRLVTISANVVGRPLGDVVRDFDAAMLKNPPPSGYNLRQAGQTELMNDTFESMAMAVALSVILMYLLMVALYESLVYPLVIMFSLPVALFGAFGGLMATHQTLNIASLIGLVMLLGLVGKNAILLVDYTNTLRRRGHDRWSAITTAGPIRLRPILMTTSAMVLAMTPLALRFGEGAETRSPMAVVVIGGLISSTMLTLVLVPVVYTIFDDFQQWLGFGKEWVREEEAARYG
ncbi:MAG: efflux RND transporter permease subunit, partial [Bacteroidetes bacterium]|nr:efflux RND transporter permease subunit [Bacteroidota bacterium]